MSIIPKPKKKKIRVKLPDDDVIVERFAITQADEDRIARYMPSTDEVMVGLDE